jgi:hypothetical protein
LLNVHARVPLSQPFFTARFIPPGGGDGGGEVASDFGQRETSEAREKRKSNTRIRSEKEEKGERRA